MSRFNPLNSGATHSTRRAASRRSATAEGRGFNPLNSGATHSTRQRPVGAPREIGARRFNPLNSGATHSTTEPGERGALALGQVFQSPQ